MWAKHVKFCKAIIFGKTLAWWTCSNWGGSSSKSSFKRRSKGGGGSMASNQPRAWEEGWAEQERWSREGGGSVDQEGGGGWVTINQQDKKATGAFD